MKFTLLSNDELQFKIKQRWDFSVPEILVMDSWCYKQIKYLIASIKNYNPTRNTYWDRLMFLEIKKGTGTIIYEVEDVQLNFQDQGENLKVISIEVSVDENTDRAKVKVNIEKIPSLVEKIQTTFAHITSGITKKIEEQKSRKFQKELDDKKLIEEIIKNKAKETITDEY
jgi:hypothetical protein